MNPQKTENQSDDVTLDQSFWLDLHLKYPFSLLLLTEKGEALYQNIHDDALSEYIKECMGKDCKDPGASHKAFMNGDISEFKEDVKLENDRIIEIHGFRIKRKIESKNVIINAITFKDISEIRRLEYLVKDNERRMRSLLDASKDVFLVVSEEGIIRNQQNSSAQGIFQGEKLIGKNLSDVFTFTAGKLDLDRALVSSHEGSSVQVFEASYKRDSTRYYLEIRIVPGIGREVVVLIRDITDLHTNEEHLHMLERNASFVDIASGISNELLNRIQSIQTCIGPLRMGEIPESLEPYINRIEEESQQSEEILKNLFTYTGNHYEEEQVFFIKEAIERALLFCRYGIPDGIKIERELIEDDIKIKAPFKQLVGVIINLIMNAREAMDNKGLIKLSLADRNLQISDKSRVQGNWEPGSYLELRVCDNGVGMSQEMIRKIFEPLFSTKSDKDSTGMGLTILNRFIKKQNGGIVVDSQLGKGTCFYLYIPKLTTEGEVFVDESSESMNLGFIPQDLAEEKIIYEFSPIAHNKAIELLEGNEELYHIICKDFILDYGNAATYIKEKLRENDWENARILVHSIKGLAGLVGSIELQEQAREYEIILKNRDKKSIKTVAVHFNACLNYVVQQLEKYLNSNKESIESMNPADLEEESFSLKSNLIEEIRKIRPFLEYSEYNEALELLGRFKQFREGDNWDFIVHNLEDLVRQFNFDEALKIIDKYTEK